MMPNDRLVRALHAQRTQAVNDAARARRLVPPRRPARSVRAVRRSVGRSMVRIGQRIAAEHAATPARST
jgi:hypothetical protein